MFPWKLDLWACLSFPTTFNWNLPVLFALTLTSLLQKLAIPPVSHSRQLATECFLPFLDFWILGAKGSSVLKNHKTWLIRSCKIITHLNDPLICSYNWWRFEEQLGGNNSMEQAAATNWLISTLFWTDVRPNQSKKLKRKNHKERAPIWC